MTDKQLHVESQRTEDGILELRCFGSPCGSSFLRWRMPIQEAEDLAQWWRTEGCSFDPSHPPIRDFRFGSILVSMFAPTLIHVRGFNEHGIESSVGYCFPSTVGEYLADALPPAEKGTADPQQESPETCSSEF